MIFSIAGNLVSSHPTHVVIETNGIGFEVFVPLSTFEKLPAVGSSIKLHTHFQVREDGFALFGFYTEHEKQVFQLLITVSKIGPKVALAILSGITISELRTAIIGQNTDRIALIPGIGKKTAERLIVELKEKISLVDESFTFKSDRPVNQNMLHDAVQALVSLGYNRISAQKAVQTLLNEKSLDSVTIENVIKSALKKIK
ncbi:MAG: Holliday junction branch migration protein RuvA [bacterium]|nr:Holliday junction branch migration protein RuvA [bacterium]